MTIRGPLAVVLVLLGSCVVGAALWLVLAYAVAHLVAR